MNLVLLLSGVSLQLGFTFALSCLVVVLVSMTLLFFVFKFMGRQYYFNKKEKATKIPDVIVNSGGDKKTKGVTNDQLAVIAIALYKYSEIMHQHEEMVLTINRVSRAYSPWSSKIFGLRQFPNKK